MNQLRSGDAANGEPSDTELMERVRDNDDACAFALLASRYRRGLRAYFAALLPRQSQDADDLTQETLLRLWQSRHTWEPTGTFSAYVFTIGRNHFANQKERYQARQIREIPLSSDSGNDNVSGIVLHTPPKTQPEAVLMERWEAARIRRAADALPPACREVFILSQFHGLTHGEIACRLNIPVGTVKSRLFDAVRRLRVRLAPDGAKEL